MAIESAPRLSGAPRLLSRSHEGDRRVPAVELAGLSLIIAVAVGLRFGTLGHQSFWYDESVTVHIVRLPGLGSAISAVARSEATPPLYYVVGWLWANVFGSGEVGLRSLSALAGVGTVPLVWAAGRRLVGPRAGLVAAALVAVNPMLVWYSQEARAYALLVLLSAASFLFFLRMRERPSPGNAAGWATASALALLTHYFAAFLVAAELVWLLVELRGFRRLVALSSVPVIVVGLALVPLAIHQEKDGRTSWIALEALSSRLGQVGHELSTANVGQITASNDLPHGGLGSIALALMIVALMLTCLATTKRERIGAGIAAAFGAASILGPLFMIVLGVDFFLDRNLIGAWVPLALIPAAGLAARRTLPIGLSVAVALCGLGVAVDIQVIRDRDIQRQNWRALVHELGPVNTTRALVVSPGYFITPLQVYGEKLPPAKPGDRVREIDLIGTLPTRAPSQPAPDVRLVQSISYNNGIRLERYAVRGLFTLTPKAIRLLPGLVMVQPGPQVRAWYGIAIPQALRWEKAAKLLREGAHEVPTSLLGPTAGSAVLANVPPELPHNVQIGQAVRQTMAAAASLKASGSTDGPADAAFQRALASLIAAVKG